MKVNKGLTEFKKMLKAASESDFDGHTEFRSLTPEQKLSWLSQCAQFVTEIKTENKS